MIEDRDPPLQGKFTKERNRSYTNQKRSFDYAFYESKRSKGVDVEYVSIQDNKITTIFFDGLSQEEIEDVLNSIE